MTDARSQTRLCVLLACFAGEATASRVKSELGAAVRSIGGSLLDDVVLKVNRKGRALVYDPRRTTAGALTPALTWGLFGLVASGGSATSVLIWGLLGAVCGGLYAYYTEHTLSNDQLKRIGGLMGPDTSALAIWAEATDPERLLSATAPLKPTTVSVAAIADDLSANVIAGDAARVEGSSTHPGDGTPATTAVLSMVLLRYPGEHAARAVLAAARKAGSDAPQVELVFESATSGKRRVSNPTTGVAAMSETDVVGWGLFGVVWGAIVGFAGNGGILGVIENGVVVGVLWAIFGLVAGALYGLWAGRGVSAGRLKGIGPLLPPDSSAILAWADAATTARTIGALSTPDAKSLALRFDAVPGGAVLTI